MLPKLSIMSMFRIRYPHKVSTSTTHTHINPLKLFTVVDIELDSLSLHHDNEGDTGASTESFPSLSKLSLPTFLVS